MITLYSRPGCFSSQRALQWFENNNVDVLEKKIYQITSEDLVDILILTNNGLADILKSFNRLSFENKIKANQINDMSFDEAVSFLLEHTYLIQTPIIIDHKKFLMGFNADQIRMFLPVNSRRIALFKNI